MVLAPLNEAVRSALGTLENMIEYKNLKLLELEQELKEEDARRQESEAAFRDVIHKQTVEIAELKRKNENSKEFHRLLNEAANAKSGNKLEKLKDLIKNF